ncbi:hypothetical protein OAG38_07640, partial [Akkermansiaceae bacterium]|nr:hypothetical protein [Akkermansiaceae bacterium]
MVKIRKCLLKDVEVVKSFISKYVRKNHILTESNKLFDSIYSCEGQINFIIGEIESEIVAILGFIPNNKFDPNINDLISGSIWAVSDTAPPGIG